MSDPHEIADEIAFGRREDWQSAPPEGHTGVEVSYVALACLIEDAIKDALATITRERDEARAMLDPPLCRRQFPDGTVPGNIVECAEGWRAAYEETREHWRSQAAEARAGWRAAYEEARERWEHWRSQAAEARAAAIEAVARVRHLSNALAEIRDGLRADGHVWIASEEDGGRARGPTVREYADDALRLWGALAAKPAPEEVPNA